MKKPIQKRTLETRARLLAAAQDLIGGQDFSALRVEDVVLKAGVAKGTFFAHFRDKDALMEQLIGAEMDAHLDAWDAAAKPATVAQITATMMPLLQFMTSERYVFDVIMRYSGATMIEEIGPIAMAIGRFDSIVCEWVDTGRYRSDVSPQLLAEGVQAFVFQAMALHFCALHTDPSLTDRLQGYLSAWLEPKA